MKISISYKGQEEDLIIMVPIKIVRVSGAYPLKPVRRFGGRILKKLKAGAVTTLKDARV